MVRETQKQLIERLKKELEEQKEFYNKLNDNVLQMQDNANEGFLNSTEYVQMNKRIDYLEKENKLLKDNNNRLIKKVDALIDDSNIQKLKDEKEHYRKLYDNYYDLLEKELNRTTELEKIINNNDIQELNNDIQELNNETIKVNNERGAGRKSRFTEEQIKEIKMYRTQGKTLKEISTMYNCSLGLIHKLINR